MKLLNTRTIFTDNSTIGKLTVDGEFLCYILEPADKGLDDGMTIAQIISTKNERLAMVPKKYTAIPTGTYPLLMVPVAPAFLQHYPYFIKEGIKDLPELQNIKDYGSVLIHIGNYENATKQDSEACQIVGMNTATDFVGGSGVAFDSLKAKCFAAISAGGVTYEIVRDPVAWEKFNAAKN